MKMKVPFIKECRVSIASISKKQMPERLYDKFINAFSPMYVDRSTLGEDLYSITILHETLSSVTSDKELIAFVKGICQQQRTAAYVRFLDM